MRKETKLFIKEIKEISNNVHSKELRLLMLKQAEEIEKQYNAIYQK